MGADTFAVVAEGKSAKDAFDRVTHDARHMNGHGGYTGTIAEKHSFVMISQAKLPLDAARALANKLIDDGDERIDDKWGDAGCIALADGRFYFFGWASS